MDQNERDQRTAPPKDFLALSHGQEWVTFYESFDKLVQDNLSRSSELLRRAMSLPEVADREVQQIRTEMEGKLSVERDKQRDFLGAVAQEIGGSHRQVAMLARSVGSVMSDLERLSQRVAEALAAYGAEPPAAPTETGALNGTRVGTGSLTPPNGGGGGRGGTGTLTAPTALAVAEAPAASAAVEPVPADEDDPFAGEFDVADIAAAVEEQQAMLDAAEQQLSGVGESIDLNAIAESESAPAEVEATAPAAEPRPRPHWLSVTRVGAGS